MIAPQPAKPYVARGKNNATDAAARCEAASRPHMRFVPAKSTAEQAAPMLAGQHEWGGAQRTPLVNTIRGHAAEFGFVAAKGPAGIGPSSSSWRRATSRRWRELFAELAEEHAGLCAQTAAVDRRLRDWHAKNEVARRLTAILGVGRLIASLLVMKAPDPPHLFKSGRDFAAWLDAARPFHGRQGAGANHGGRRSDAAQPAYR